MHPSKVLIVLLLINHDMIPWSTKVDFDQNRTTPHPPAVFRSQKFFSWDFLQMIAPDRATTGDLQRAGN